MRTHGSAVVFPAELLPKVNLEPLGQHSLVLRAYQPENGFEALVVYPDGHQHHHQCFSVIELLDKVGKVLKQRYNILDFQYQAVPQALEPSTITIGEIKYG